MVCGMQFPVNESRGVCVAHVTTYTPFISLFRYRQCPCGCERHDMRLTRVKCGDERYRVCKRRRARGQSADAISPLSFQARLARPLDSTRKGHGGNQLARPSSCRSRPGTSSRTRFLPIAHSSPAHQRDQPESRRNRALYTVRSPSDLRGRVPKCTHSHVAVVAISGAIITASPLGCFETKAAQPSVPVRQH
jgi:hypothetical protein